MWSVLTTTVNSPDIEEITIDSAAKWKPTRNQIIIKTEDDSENKQRQCYSMTKAMSPGSMHMPTINNNWDMNQVMSPYMPPDMNSIVSGSMINNTHTYPNNSINHRNTSGGSYDINTISGSAGNNDYINGAGPLSHLSDSVNSLDPLNAMEKSLNDQVNNIKFLLIFLIVFLIVLLIINYMYFNYF